MRLAIAADHAGFAYKQVLIPDLSDAGHDLLDLGTHDESPVDYPDFAEAVAEAVVASRAARGILICGSAVGVSVAANKIPGIRAGVCHDTYSARQAVEHDDINVLCIGQRALGVELAREIVRAFLAAEFSGEERHVRRLGKVREIEARHMKDIAGRETGKAG